MTIAEQMLDQIAIGNSMDSGGITLNKAFEKVKNNDSQPHIFPDAILFLDENHTVASQGGYGHDGSFSGQQCFVSVDENMGDLKKQPQGGVMLQRRYKIVVKYTKEAHVCNGVCCPVVGGEEKPQFMTILWDYMTKSSLVQRHGSNLQLQTKRMDKF
jgi:hypothetical protein